MKSKEIEFLRQNETYLLDKLNKATDLIEQKSNENEVNIFYYNIEQV